MCIYIKQLVGIGGHDDDVGCSLAAASRALIQRWISGSLAILPCLARSVKRVDECKSA
jgi:hypothetical protein